MNEILEHLQSLTSKVNKLETHVQKLVSERNALREALAAEKAQKEKSQVAFTAMEEKYETLKLVKNLNEGKNSEEIKAKIDE